ncbi:MULTISPECIES: hypothetical protein [Acidobacteriaceae]|uniref:hypothetical protein n=1 Tax=Acidobacteriaceae TaxID=204434 RepID=UPI00131EA1F3|nr:MULTISPECIES: hypothetical protein [Acidobacteriaceae]MDW5267427.1 hypothetical protein [Edaphobacter sp.]
MNIGVGVVALQTSPYVASLYADDRILAGGVVRLSPEDLYPNEPFLEQLVVTADLLIDNILEELLTSPAGSEMSTGQDAVQLFSNERWC